MRAYLIGFMAVMTACVAPAPVEQTVPADLSSAQGQVQVETESPATTSPGASTPEGTKPLPNGPADDPSTAVLRSSAASHYAATTPTYLAVAVRACYRPHPVAARTPLKALLEVQ